MTKELKEKAERIVEGTTPEAPGLFLAAREVSQAYLALEPVVKELVGVVEELREFFAGVEDAVYAQMQQPGRISDDRLAHSAMAKLVLTKIHLPLSKAQALMGKETPRTNDEQKMRYQLQSLVTELCGFFRSDKTGPDDEYQLVACGDLTRAHVIDQQIRSLLFMLNGFAPARGTSRRTAHALGINLSPEKEVRKET